MINSVLVVCTGNICRSPMVEGLLKAFFPELNVMSAGLAALMGRAPDPIAIEIMADRRVDIADHRARQLESWMCKEFDLVLVMEMEQKRALEARFPFARGKVFRLCEADGSDVPDPYKRGRRAFELALEAAEFGVNAWRSKLERVAHVWQ
ncbi:protein-tyrosine-phosphatase [Burkholderia sp. Ch1-1]|nr:protein-tyrosine-phosphatase [Burkholderia sp. Ch1-1]